MDFAFWLELSDTVLLVSSIIALFGFISRKEQDWALSSLQAFTLGVFFSVFLLLLPVCHQGGDLAGDLAYGYIGEALHRTLRVFVVDTDFKDLVVALEGQLPELQMDYQRMGMVLYILAPVLLFGNLLALFRNLWGEVRLFYVCFSPIYLFSELNDRSIALAEDIHRKPPKTRFPWLRRVLFPPVIVFAEVYAQNREQDQELLDRAKAMHAICLKKDAARVDFYDKWSRVEIFLIGEKEEENVSQAMTIMGKLSAKNKKKVQLYVFSRKESDGCILDSLEYGPLEDHLKSRMRRLLRREKWRRRKCTQEELDKLALQDRYAFALHDGKSFSLRRVDVVQHLVWSRVPRMKLLSKAMDNGGELSVLILGFGSYGQEFFKMLTWFCQFEGLRLKLTVVDKENDPGALSLIGHQCPELMAHNRARVDGDAQYDIEILSGVDMQGDAFRQMLCYEGVNAPKAELAQRLRKTDLVFVSMGDDDLNVETALHLRTLTDRVRNVTAEERELAETEPVQIYAVVFDEVKAKLLRSNEKNRAGGKEDGFFLQNHKNQKLHIRFIGGLKEQFSYDRINWQELERQAYYHHRSWEEIAARIQAEKHGSKQEKVVNQEDQEQKEKLNYHKYEYYRNSSIAKALYQRAVREELPELSHCQKDGNRQTCQCPGCIRRKKSEHMRWNAYMRICGWVWGKRDDRAKRHKDLVPWDMLGDDDKLKD